MKNLYLLELLKLKWQEKKYYKRVVIIQKKVYM